MVDISEIKYKREIYCQANGIVIAVRPFQPFCLCKDTVYQKQTSRFVSLIKPDVGCCQHKVNKV
jgi:hypothetical protein